MKKNLLVLALVSSLAFAVESDFDVKNSQLKDNSLTIEDMQEEEYIKKVQEQMKVKVQKQSQPKVTPKSTTYSTTQKKPVEKTYTKKELDVIIQKTKAQTEQKTKEIVKKELESVKPVEQFIYVKPRADVANKMTTATINNGVLTKDILPFLSVEISSSKLVINSEHNIFKKFNIDKENKIVLDYRANVDFQAKKENLGSKHFKNISVSNNKNAEYFRVAIELNSNPSNFDIEIDNSSVVIHLKH